MRGPKPSYPITLTDAEARELEHLVRAHTTAQALALRARIILQAHAKPEQSNQQLASALGTTDRTVRKWRGRWVKTHQLADAPRSGAPRRFSPQVRVQVTAIACSLPKQEQVPLSRWSRAELARRVTRDPALAHISASTVGRWLKAERLRTWRYHCGPHIHDPVSFLQRARPVLHAYGQAQALLGQGVWLLSLDEKTSIQAREGEQPPHPLQPGKPMLHEARYHRRGARHLFAGLSVADGKVYGTWRPRKCYSDFQAFVRQEIIPEALRRHMHTVILILDNGTTHAPKQLERWLQEQEHVCDGRLHFQVHWLPPNASWLDQIEIWFSLLQRKCLRPNHFVSTHALETALAEYVSYYNQTAKPINWTYTVEKLEQQLEKRV
jgi:transposase